MAQTSKGKKGVWELEGDMLPTSDGELELVLDRLRW